MIQLRSVTLDLGVHHIFSDISCVFQRDDRAGIIGRNGAGKSTLLKVIAGLIKPTSGSISIERGARIAYLPQEEVLASTLNVFDEAFSAYSRIFEAEKRIEIIDTSIANGTCTSEQLEEYAELQEILRSFDRPEAVKKTNEILKGLGFTDTMIKKSVNELSTGWKMRLALTKLLLTDADMYLFDEPTNHLDIVTQQWFLNKLLSMPQGFLLVSHDRAYLEKACNSILEIERGHGTFYRGNLQKYLVLKEETLAIARATRARQEREIAQMQATADRFRAGTRSQEAKNIMRQIERVELVEVDPPLPTIHFKFPTPIRPGEVVLKFDNLSFGFGDTPLFRTASGEIHRGERVALVAANGVGKTTLLNCLVGRYTPMTGTIKLGHNVQPAFFEQDQARTLAPEKSIFDEVRDACSNVADGEVRAILGAFQFRGDDIYKKTKVLSGGEKNRVAMAKVLLQRANFLILDEPTNHLDLYAKDVLYQSLAAYQGTILFVSHDLDFVEKLATRIVELTPTSAHSYPGTYAEYATSKQLTLAPAESSQPTRTAAQDHATAHQEQTVRKQRLELERTILRLEKEQTKLAQLLAEHPYGSIAHKQALSKITEVQKQLKIANDAWASLD